MRFNSGGAAVAVASPKPPKLFTCYRSNQEAWSSNGSRHSSRPGSSASSRPPSQCAGVAPATVNTNTLYSKSTNSSLSDVSVARNFQDLSVSTRRAAFKTQKWSHSFDQGGATQPGVTLTCSNSTSAAYPTGSSPGKRRQSSLQQKSLDLDSGYGGNSSFDLKSQSSWGNYAASSALNDPNHLSVCSPISDAQLELRQLIKQESKEKKCFRLAPTSSEEVEGEDGEEEEEEEEEDEEEEEEEAEKGGAESCGT